MRRHGSQCQTPEEAFARVLRSVRKKRGLSQEQLGFESGYHRTYIGMLERGLMCYTFARVSAMVHMRVEDYYQNGKRSWLQLHEKGGTIENAQMIAAHE